MRTLLKYLWLLLPCWAHAQTLYLVSIGGTQSDNQAFNQTSLVTLNTLDQKVKEIAISVGYRYQLLQLSDERFNKNSLKATIDKMQIQPFDMIIFTILAHGYHDKNLPSPIVGGKTSTFPTPLLSYEFCHKSDCWDNAYLPFEHFVRYIYQTKRPRLLISLIDACNKEEEISGINLSEKYGVNDRLLEINPEKYIINGPSAKRGRELLLSRTGLLLISSTSVGQLAAGSPKSGSNYTVKFCNTIRDLLSSDNALTFERLVSDLSSEINPSKTKAFGSKNQTPQVFNITQAISPPPPPPPPSPPSYNDGTNYIIEGRNRILVGNWAEALKIFQNGLRQYPNNEDLKMAIFVSEVNLGYEKFSTISFAQLRQNIENSPKIFEQPGFAYLQYLIGMSYMKGINGFSADLKQAAKWFILSFDNGNKNPACRMLTRLGLNKCMDLL